MADKFSSRYRGVTSMAVLAFGAFYCVLPLVLYQNLPYAQDIVFHIFQADQFSRAINEGIAYPRWVPDSNNGYGSANFIFYAPLSYYVVSFINLLIPSLIASMIITLWCGFFFSGVTMLIAAKRLFGESGSLLSAIFYQIVPFHLIDLYSRGVFAELLAFIWFPLIFLYLHETLFPGRATASPGLSLSYAGLIFTHLVSGFIFSIAIAGYLLFFFIRESRFPIKTFLSLGLGLGLSSVYLIPVFFERKFVQIDIITSCPICDYRKNFLFTWDKIQARLTDFYTPLHIAVVLEVLLFMLILMWLRKFRQMSAGNPRGFFIMLFLAAFFLTTPLSAPLWNILPGLPTLQFPWRWMSAMEVSLCFLVGSVFSAGDAAGLKTATAKRVFCIMIIIALASSVAIFRSKTLPRKFTEDYMLPAKLGSLIDPILEYTPIEANDMKTLLSVRWNNKVEVVSGRAAVYIAEWKSERRVLSIEASDPSILRISTFYYPGWKAWIDGSRMEIKMEKEIGAMLLAVPEGKHTVDLRFTDTPLRLFSKIVSAASLLAIISPVIIFRVKRTRSFVGK